MMEIRPARAGDLDAVRRCAVAAYEIYVDRIGRKPAPMVADFDAASTSGELYVLQVGDAIHGFIVLFPRAGHIFVENVAVDPAQQGRGYGRRLLDFAEAEARRLGLPALELYTNAKMTENLALYPRVGYLETGRRTEDGFDRVYFRKVLTD
ncbi:GNAT family N-acetyltransferase [Hwanghaeella sp.]|uniref:GNAT family N-acetyltransferase n=1 Tax=Hwanghaeella sp. TaxID=2605943 RepID=UPI003CCBB887